MKMSSTYNSEMRYLMSRTFEGRRQWILHNEKATVQAILSRFPFLATQKAEVGVLLYLEKIFGKYALTYLL